MESKIFYTVFKDVDADQLTQQYPLTADGQFCVPLEGIRKNDDGSFTGYTVIAWDKSKATAENMLEINSFDCEFFNDANEYSAWRDKNPIEFDANGDPILTQPLIDRLKGWLTGWFK